MLKLDDLIELFDEALPGLAIREAVNRFFSDCDRGMALV